MLLLPPPTAVRHGVASNPAGHDRDVSLLLLCGSPGTSNMLTSRASNLGMMPRAQSPAAWATAAAASAAARAAHAACRAAICHSPAKSIECMGVVLGSSRKDVVPLLVQL